MSDKQIVSVGFIESYTPIGGYCYLTSDKGKISGWYQVIGPDTLRRASLPRALWLTAVRIWKRARRWIVKTWGNEGEKVG